MSSSDLPEVVAAPPAPSPVEEIVEEGDKKVVEEGDEKVVEEGHEKVLEEAVEEVDDEVVEEVIEEVVEDVIEAAITIVSNAEMCAKDESQDQRQSFKFLNAYSFLGDTAEFFKPPYHTAKKLRGLVSRFRTPLPQKVSEFPLQMFANWYAEDLPMVAALVECTNRAGIAEPWHYTVVILNPSGASSGKATRKTDDKFDAHCRLAVEFYHSEFTADKNDYVSFTNAVMSDVTVMILGFRLGEKEDPTKVFTSSMAGRKDAIVIAAVTYRCGGTKEECGTSLILWFLVSPGFNGKPALPLQLSSWRRLGFGRLLLLMVIKRSTISVLDSLNLAACEAPLPGVDIYLQATQPHAFTFYQSCGFVHINSRTGTDGFELLPKSIRDTIIPDTDSSYAFMFAKMDATNALSKDGDKKNTASNDELVNAVSEDDVVKNAVSEEDAKDAVEEGDVNVLVPIHLYRLRSGCLLKTAIEVEVEKDASLPGKDAAVPISEPPKVEDPVWLLPQRFSFTRFTWCQFPWSLRTRLPFGDGIRLLKDSDLRSAYSNLLQLDLLLPPSESDVLLHPSKMRIKGEITSGCRLEHSQLGGCAWMKGSQVEMMLSIILRDGRYDSSMSILSLLHMQKIAAACAAAGDAVAATRFRKSTLDAKRKEFEEAAKKDFLDLEQVDKKDAEQQRYDQVCDRVIQFGGEELDKLTIRKYGALEPALDKKAQVLQDMVLNQVLVYYPGLLDKRIIVFPINYSNSHWGVTFIFNACQIEYCPVGSKCDGPARSHVPCFFRYCSLHPSGDGMLSNKHGIIWFLNLAYSQNQHGKLVDEMGVKAPPFSYMKPFGTRLFAGNMFGSKQFPSLRVPGEDVLPRQIDAHSCGIGMVACIAIILRDILGHSEPAEMNRYHEMFYPDVMKWNEVELPPKAHKSIRKERVAYLPDNTFKPLPTSSQYQSINYLHLLKAQWFLLFDRLAELQHVTLRNVVAGSDERKVEYFQVMKEVLNSCAWPESPELLTLDGSKKAPSPEKSTTEVTSIDLNGPLVMEDGITSVTDLDDIPPPNMVWNGSKKASRTKKKKAYHPVLDVDDPKIRPMAKFGTRYYPHASENGKAENFVFNYRDKRETQRKPMMLTKEQKKEMEAFVDAAFKRWKWDSNEQHRLKLASLRREMARKLQRTTSPKEQSHIRTTMGQKISFLAKERRNYRRSFELEWMFSTEAMVTALKYDPLTSSFSARLSYVEKERNKLLPKEEIIPLSEEWIKEAGYKPGVIEHVINMGSVDDFVEVNPGEERFRIQTKKVQRLRYVPPTYRVVPEHVDGGKQLVRGKGKKVHRSVTAGYWMVIFENETQALRVDDAFVSNFPPKFLEEVKRMRCGFVDIPVGDFKISHLDQHPELIRQDAPKVHFTQTDGEDLCVSKSLASVLHIIGFTEEAIQLDNYGREELAGGTLDAYEKACQEADRLLPPWVQRSTKYHERFPVDSLFRNQFSNEVIVVGVLAESDGNASHAVSIHAGWIYDANETTALPLSMEGMNYCCSTATVKNTFVRFQKINVFYYEGENKLKRNAMRLPRDRGFISEDEMLKLKSPYKRRRLEMDGPGSSKRRKLIKEAGERSGDNSTSAKEGIQSKGDEDSRQGNDSSSSEDYVDKVSSKRRKLTKEAGERSGDDSTSAEEGIQSKSDEDSRKRNDSSSSEDDVDKVSRIAAEYEFFIPDNPSVATQPPMPVDGSVASQPFPKKDFRLGCVMIQVQSDESSSSEDSIELALIQARWNDNEALHRRVEAEYCLSRLLEDDSDDSPTRQSGT